MIVSRKRHPAPAEARPRPGQRRRQARRHQDVGEMRASEPQTVFGDEPAQFGPVPIHADGGTCCARRSPAPGCGSRRTGRWAPPSPPSRSVRGRSSTAAAMCGTSPSIARGGEGRRQDAALVAPGGALADQQAVAQQRAQDAQRPGGARVGALVVDEHPADRLGLVEDEAGAAQEPAAGDGLLVGAPREADQPVVADRGEVGEERQVALRRPAVRRHEARQPGEARRRPVSRRDRFEVLGHGR